MKALSSVLLVLVAAATPAFADSAYFLESAKRSTPAATTSIVVRANPVRTDRISTHYLPASLTKSVKGVTPTMRPYRIFTRGAGQAAIVR